MRLLMYVAQHPARLCTISEAAQVARPPQARDGCPIPLLNDRAAYDAYALP